MNKIKLTKTVVADLPFANKGKQVDYYDTELDGFGVRVSHTGKKYFVRRLLGIKRIRAMIGSAAVKSAEVARSEARIKLGAMESGIDPNEQKRERKQRQVQEKSELTVKKLVSEYIEKHAKTHKKSWAEDQRCLEKEVLPIWGNQKAKNIKKRDVVLLLEGIVDRGSPVMANNTFEKVRKMFNWAIEKDHLEYSPCFGVKKPTKKEHKDRVLSDSEIKTLWYSLDTAAMTPEMRRALKLILVTAQRPGEVIGMHSSEIDGEWWTIPAERAKNGYAHRVYLTATALDLIGTKQGFIFESPRPIVIEGQPDVPKPIGGNAVAYAVRRNLEYPLTDDKGNPLYKKDGKPATENKLLVDKHTPHDYRRTAATKLASLDFIDEVIDAVLNHVKKGVAAIYNLYKYDRQKQQALQAWERCLLSNLTGKQLGNVIDLHRKKS